MLDDADNAPQRFEAQLHAMLQCTRRGDVPSVAPRTAGTGLADWTLGALRALKVLITETLRIDLDTEQ